MESTVLNYTPYIKALEHEDSNEFGEFIQYGIGASLVSGAVGLVNTATSIGNMFGADFERVDVEETLDTWGFDEAADYYMDNRALVDGIGLVASSIIPGIAGLKAAKAVQSGVAGLSGTSSRVVGLRKVLLPKNRAQEMHTLIRKESANRGTRSGQILNASKEGFHQAAVEGVFIEAAILATTAQNSAFTKEDISYLEAVGNNLGTVTTGILFGGAIGGVVNTAIGFKALKGVIKDYDKEVAATFIDGGLDTARGRLDILSGDRLAELTARYEANSKALASIGAGTDALPTSALKQDGTRIQKELFRNIKEEVAQLTQELQTSSRGTTLASIDNNITEDFTGLLLKLPEEQRSSLLFNLEQVKSFNEYDPLLNTAAKPLDDLIDNSWASVLSRKGTDLQDSLELREMTKRLVTDFEASPLGGMIPVRDSILRTKNTKDVTSILRLEVGIEGNKNRLKDILRGENANPVAKKLDAELEEISRALRPDQWKYAEVPETLTQELASLNAKVATKTTNLTKEEIIRHGELLENLTTIHSTRDKLLDPDQLLQDAYVYLTSTKNGEKYRKKYSTTASVMRNNPLLRNKLGTSEVALDIRTGKMYVAGDRTGTVRDRGKVTSNGNSVTWQLGQQKNTTIIKKNKLNIMELGPEDASAHYYAAATARIAKNRDMVVEEFDFYNLNAIYDKVKKGQYEGILTVNTDDSLEATFNFADSDIALKAFEDFYKKQKNKVIANLRNSDDYNYSDSDIARIVDVDEDYVRASGMDGGIAFFSSVYNPLKPSAVRLKYRTRNAIKDPYAANALAESQRAIKEAQMHAVAEVNRFLYTLDPKLPSRFVESQVESGTNFGRDITAGDDVAGVVSANQGQYSTGTSFVQSVGQANINMKTAGNNAILLTMDAAEVRVKNAPQAVAEGAVLDSLLRQDFYVFAPDIDDIQGIKTAFAERAVGNGVAPDVALKRIDALFKDEEVATAVKSLFATGNNKLVTTKLYDVIDDILQAGAVSKTMKETMKEIVKKSYKIENAELADFWRARVKANGMVVEGKRVIAGLKGLETNIRDDVLYPGGLDPRRYKQVSFVIPTKQGVMGSMERGIIGAPDEATLLRKEAKIREKFGDDVLILKKKEAEAYYKDRGEFDSDLALKEWRANSEMQRKGLLADAMPEPVPELFDAYRRDMVAQWNGVADNITEIRYAEEFAALEKASRVVQFQSSVFGKDVKSVDNFMNQTAVMLNKENPTQFGWWRDTQEGIDKGITKALNGLASFFYKKTSPVDYDSMNKYMDKMGLPKVYDEEVGKVLIQTHGVPETLVNDIVPQLNGAAATLMLRLDMIQPLINAISTPITTFPEIKHLIDSLPAQRQLQIKKALTAKMPDEALRAGMDGKVPEYGMFSNMKLMHQAVKDFFSNKDLAREYYERGYSASIVKEMRDITDTIALDPRVLKEQGVKAYKNVGTAVVDKLSFMSDFSEEFVKFTAARMADILLTNAGIVDDSIKHMAINTFVKRVHGNYTYAQRPALFKGIVGQAVGLFQTYQFNLFQQLLRHVGDKQVQAASAMMGIQAGIFGTQSVPGFRAMNAFIAEKSQYEDDFFTLSQDVVGQETSEWIMYGLASNLTKPIMGHGLELYTRGDLNPRTPFIIPTSLQEIPVVSLSTKLVGSIMQAADAVGEGVPAGQVFSEALASNGVNRPLAGLGQLLSGARTTSKGSLIATTQDMDWVQRLARIAGTKTLDESIAVQTYYRAKGYQSLMQEKKNQLGRNMRTMIRSGDFNPAVMHNFAKDYASAGGDMEGYAQWIHRQAASATTSQIQDMYKAHNTREGRYIQAVLGADVEQYVGSPYTNGI